MTVGECLAEAQSVTPLERRILLAHVLRHTRAWLAAHPEDTVEAQRIAEYRALCARRSAGEPIAYIVGSREFFGLSLAVTPAVLIPRPETELLVELALANMPPAASCRVLDLGTGSGAIALALARQRPQARITAADRDPAALELARANAESVALAGVEFVQSDWFAQMAQRTWDLIVANPPYIAGNDPHLSESDLRFEPRAALSPEGDGLDALRHIVAQAPSHLVAHGRLWVEHGWDQGEAVRQLFARAGFRQITTMRDLGGQERVTGGLWSEDSTEHAW